LAYADAARALGHEPAAGEVARVEAEVAELRAAEARIAAGRARLERLGRAEAEHAAESRQVAVLEAALAALRERLRSITFSGPELAAAADALSVAKREQAEASAARRRALEALAEARSALANLTTRREEAVELHRRVDERSDEARHVGRTAELLAEFRESLAATIGPRLAAQAAELFAELTDSEYDTLTVSPDTYEIMVRDAGQEFGMARFSGSETDLANLALRIAISEQVRFQAGGAVGLLVLDEVFGPLDEGRKLSMLTALERLRGRFGQILVVTHDPEMKEQLPAAIEVRKLPGRRARASLVGTG
ncbi:MAG: P-loop NTPase family protein, partial [Acidimicrobiales bacterium]